MTVCTSHLRCQREIRWDKWNGLYNKLTHILNCKCSDSHRSFIPEGSELSLGTGTILHPALWSSGLQDLPILLLSSLGSLTLSLCGSWSPPGHDLQLGALPFGSRLLVLSFPIPIPWGRTTLCTGSVPVAPPALPCAPGCHASPAGGVPSHSCSNNQASHHLPWPSWSRPL